MAGKPLRLLNDSPYQGESLSSFLGRTAQFYGMPFDALMEQLMGGHEWDAKGRPDLDLNPPDVLQACLAESVENWRSPVDEHQGFHGWVLAPKCRNAYCPLCFYQDLANGTTPYFRMDWMAVFVSICWEHGTPLMEWRGLDCHGRRRLPKGWLFRSRRERVVWPAFFSRHCQRLVHLDEPLRDKQERAPREVFGYLHGLQAAVEKRSAWHMATYPMAQSPSDAVRSFAKELVLSFVAGDIPLDAVVVSSWLNFDGCSGPNPWYVLDPQGFREQWRSSLVDNIRQVKVLERRRALLYLAARVLADSKGFGQTISYAHPIKSPWKAWRQDEVWRAVLANQECSFPLWFPWAARDR